MSVRRGRPWVAHPVREGDGRMGGRVRRVPNRILAKWQRQRAQYPALAWFREQFGGYRRIVTPSRYT